VLLVLSAFAITEIGVVIDLTLNEGEVEWVFTAAFASRFTVVLLFTNNFLDV